MMMPRRPAGAQHAQTQSPSMTRLTSRRLIKRSIITGRMIAPGVSGLELTVYCSRLQSFSFFLTSLGWLCFLFLWYLFNICSASCHLSLVSTWLFSYCMAQWKHDFFFFLNLANILHQMDDLKLLWHLFSYKLPTKPNVCNFSCK